MLIEGTLITTFKYYLSSLYLSLFVIFSIFSVYQQTNYSTWVTNFTPPLFSLRLSTLVQGEPDIVWVNPIISKYTIKLMIYNYRSSNNIFVILLSSTVGVSKFPFAEIAVLVDLFRVHQDWHPGQGSCLIYDHQPSTYLPQVSSLDSNHLDLFLATHPDPYQIIILTFFSRKDHGLISISYPTEPDSCFPILQHLALGHFQLEWAPWILRNILIQLSLIDITSL